MAVEITIAPMIVAGVLATVVGAVSGGVGAIVFLGGFILASLLAQ